MVTSDEGISSPKTLTTMEGRPVIMADDVNSYQVMFLLGAGASVEADVPDTYGLVQKFRNENRDNIALSNTIDKIVSILGTWRKDHKLDEKVDIELLLETLEKLRNPDQEALLRFYRTTSYALEGYQDKKPIIDILRDFIKSTAIVHRLKVRYLSSFLEFIEQFTSIDIFTVNYDTAIEEFCSLYRKSLVDGFDSQWNPDSFKKKVDIRLYKLHGSVTWYRTDSGEYVKIPIKVPTDTISLVSDEKASSLILYPMRKWEYTEPLLELLFMLKRALELVKCCIVIGYSFRDDHITRIFLDAARKNPDLCLILIGPNAENIYNQKLKFYGETTDEDFTIKSSLAGKVVCLPYWFGDIFPHLREMRHKLDNGLGWEKRVWKEMLLGTDHQTRVTNIGYSIQSFIEAEHLEKVQEMYSSIIDWKTVPSGWRDQLQWSYKMWFHHVWRRHTDEAINEWADRFIAALAPFDARNLDVWPQGPNIMLRFIVRGVQVGTRETFESTMQLAGWAISQLALLRPGENPDKIHARDLLSNSSKAVDELLSYLRPWQNDSISVDQYANLRRDEKARIEKIEIEFKELKAAGLQGGFKMAPDMIKEIEGSLLSPIISGLKARIVAPINSGP